MHLRSLTTKGFKGALDRIDLGDRRLLLATGPNGSGKTSLIEAISYAIRGRTKIGGRPEDTAKLGGHAGLEVVGTTSDGFNWARTLSRHPKTRAISMSARAGGETGKDADATIKERLGEFAPTFDLSEFTGLSPDKRRAFILGLCATATPKDASDSERLAWRTRIEVYRAHHDIGPSTVDLAMRDRDDAAADEMLAEHLPRRFRQYMDETIDSVVNIDVSDLAAQLNCMVDGATKAKNTAHRDKGESDAASRKLSDRKNQIGVISGNVADMNAEIEQLRAQKEEHVKQKANQEGRNSARESLNQQIERKRRSLAGNKRTLDGYESDKGPSLSDAEQMEAEALEKEQTLESFDGATMDAANESLSEGTRELMRTGDKLTKLRREQENAKRVLMQYAESIELAKNDVFGKSLALLEEILAIIPELGDLDKYAELRTLLHEHSKIDDVSKLQESYEKQMPQCKGIDEDAACAELEFNEIETRLETQKADLEEAREQQREHAKRSNSLRELINALRSDASKILSRREGMISTITSLQNLIDSEKSELVDLECKLNDLDSDGGTVDLDSLDAVINGADIQIKAIKQNIEQKKSYDRLAEELARCVSEAEEQRSLYDAASAVVDAVKVVREEVIDELVRPVTDRVREFLRAGGMDINVYCDLSNINGRAIFDLGWIVDDTRKISMDALSGGESAVFCAALLYALTMLADPPLKLLLIEAGECDMATTLCAAYPCAYHSGRHGSAKRQRNGRQKDTGFPRSRM
jgi:chromosome segregation ATPase